jgi:branched-chain amino acid transport system permease protein
VTDFLQTTEGVVTAASVYLLIGFGWNLVYNSCGYLNLAIGQFYVLGAVLSFELQDSVGIESFIVRAVIVILGLGLLGYVSERLLLRPLGDNQLGALIVTIGLALILLQVAREMAPGIVVQPSPFVEGSFRILDVVVTWQELVVWITAGAVALAVLFFFTRTDTGRAVRACADDRESARFLGLNVAGYGTAAFTASAMLAGLAAFVISPTQGIAYNSGDLIAIKAFLAVSIGGIGNYRGAIVGAFVVAAAEAYVARYWSSAVRDVVVLTGFILVLCIYAARGQSVAGAARALAQRTRLLQAPGSSDDSR